MVAAAPANDALDAKAAVLLTTLCLLWGVNSVAIKYSNTGIDPVFAAGLRSAIASVGLAGWMRLRRIPLFPERVLDGLVAGVLFGAEFGLLYCALLYTTAASAFLLLYTTPFFHAVGAHVFLKGDRLTRFKATGLLVAFTGVAVLMSRHMGKPVTGRLMGDLLALGAAIAWAVTTIYIKRRLVGRVTPYNTLFFQTIFSAPVLFGLSAAFGEAPVRAVNGLILVSVAYQGVVVAFLSYLVWFQLVHTRPVSRLSAFTFLAPVFAALAGVVLLGEPITLRLVLSLLLVSIGIYVVNRN
jgi:drug/metabolite transporter (DMT)-like permease